MNYFDERLVIICCECIYSTAIDYIQYYNNPKVS